jgi:hypothetical protein
MTIEIEDEFLVYLQAALYMIHSSLEGAEVGSVYVDEQIHGKDDEGLPDFGRILDTLGANPWFKEIVSISTSLKVKQKFKYEGSIDEGTYKVTPLSKWNGETQEWEGPDKNIFA